MDISYIKNKLLNFQLSFEDYQKLTGNLVGNVNVPVALKAFNKRLTIDDAYYLVTNKVFEVANMLAFGIPGVLQEEYQRIVSAEDILAFKEAIFEEINHRFLSNSFPEFEKAGSIGLSNVNYNPSTAGGISIFDWMNALSKQKIASINWRKYDDNYDVMRDRVYMYRNGSNANLGIGQLRVLGASSSGAMITYDHESFAQVSKLNLLTTTVNSNFSDQTKLTSDFNQVKTDLYNNYATIKYVNDVSLAMPKMGTWERDKVYNIPSFVIQANKIYWNVLENNIGNIPGGISGENKWILVNEIVTEFTRKDVVHAAGTDLKQSYTNPNKSFYIDLAEIIAIDELNIDKLFSYINNNTSVENLQLTEVQEFYTNLCNSNPDILKKAYQIRTAFNLGEIKLFSLKHNEASFDNFVENYGLVIYEDYEMLEDDCFLCINDALEQIAGSNYIKQNDLPQNMTLKFTSYQLFNNQTDNQGTIRYINTTGDIAINKWRGDNNWGGVKVTDNENWADVHHDIYFNGNVTQTEFKPKHLNVVGIRFLKDIPTTKLKWFANVVNLSLLGQVVKQIDLEIQPEALMINKLKRGK